MWKKPRKSWPPDLIRKNWIRSKPLNIKISEFRIFWITIFNKLKKNSKYKLIWLCSILTCPWSKNNRIPSILKNHGFTFFGSVRIWTRTRPSTPLIIINHHHTLSLFYKLTNYHFTLNWAWPIWNHPNSSPFDISPTFYHLSYFWITSVMFDLVYRYGDNPDWFRRDESNSSDKRGVESRTVLSNL